ncbi:hypothetical protein SADUNF_Sadunf03G0163600 [Salix dunnii]|uniref:Uncharacterized protein n=1 Tax=Salix dunnii TaxID=1413687 RepID=A0A835N5C0_9ROSI|nr:hypothetical protein SADUNF_Sadunf03G0163600 [Salix dunnii]
MASAPRPTRPTNFTLSEQWLLIAATVFICGFLGYVVYDAVMATASEMLQRLLVISPLILIISVHWLSAGWQFSIPIPGSEPGAIHRAGGSPWGVAFVLLLLVFLISHQPSPARPYLLVSHSCEYHELSLLSYQFPVSDLRPGIFQHVQETSVELFSIESLAEPAQSPVEDKHLSVSVSP